MGWCVGVYEWNLPFEENQFGASLQKQRIDYTNTNPPKHLGPVGPLVDIVYPSTSSNVSAERQGSIGRRLKGLWLHIGSPGGSFQSRHRRHRDGMWGVEATRIMGC